MTVIISKGLCKKIIFNVNKFYYNYFQIVKCDFIKKLELIYISYN